MNALFCGEGVEEIADFVPEGIDGAFGVFAKQGLELAEQFFNRIKS